MGRTCNPVPEQISAWSRPPPWGFPLARHETTHPRCMVLFSVVVPLSYNSPALTSSGPLPSPCKLLRRSWPWWKSPAHRHRLSTGVKNCLLRLRRRWLRRCVGQHRGRGQLQDAIRLARHLRCRFENRFRHRLQHRWRCLHICLHVRYWDRSIWFRRRIVDMIRVLLLFYLFFFLHCTLQSLLDIFLYCKSRIFCMRVAFVYFVRGGFRTKIKCMRKVKSKSENPQRSATVRKFHAYETFWIDSNGFGLD